ncbi:hypothetical protein GBAR_LOCUS17946 [Geodia barretti]|uniref:Fibronectin type-III domain-containing protein n=1 Tax=Geodia barretti TaxID=519541 RepID=A0AA35WYW4_GEOBA|nr:hypothetical protein GBAR_LOCUS17946 [Geodia barretti]
MGNCCKRGVPLIVREPGAVVGLTAIQDAVSGSVTLRWVPPMERGDDVTSYDVRFKPVGAAHYTYAPPVDDLGRLEITLTRTDGLPPLTHCNFDVRAKINENPGPWGGLVQFVEWTCRLPDVSGADGAYHENISLHFAAGITPNSAVSSKPTADHATHNYVAIIFVSAMECCLFRECPLPKSRGEGSEYHFCNLFHLRMAKLRNLSALLELNGPNDKFKELCKLFAKKRAKGSAPVVQSVLQVVNPSVEERFQAYIESLPRRHRKVEQYFHGTSLACNILEHLVICSEFSQSMDECGACDIIQSGFETRKIGNRWQRFGPGFYLSSKSSRLETTATEIAVQVQSFSAM